MNAADDQAASHRGQDEYLVRAHRLRRFRVPRIRKREGGERGRGGVTGPAGPCRDGAGNTTSRS